MVNIKNYVLFRRNIYTGIELSFVSFDSIFMQARTKPLGLGRPEVKPVERALVDERSPYGYLKSHPAIKQEAQLQKVDQSAGLSIFSVFFSIVSKILPKCNVANFIRQSFLYKKAKENEVSTCILDNYPLKGYYIRKEFTISFYYHKNNLISFYIHQIYNVRLNRNFHIIPLYNYIENKYELIISYFVYECANNYAECVFRAPNRQVYLLSMLDKWIILGNISKDTILYQSRKEANYLFHSMPIANSFILLVMSTWTNHEEGINIYVIDLIKEKLHSIHYPREKIMESILSLSEKTIHNEVIKSIKKIYDFSFERNVINSIDNSIANLVFYDRCVINISLSALDVKTDRMKLRDALGIVASYQNNELIVNLQINKKIKIQTSHGEYDVDFGSDKLLISDKYKVDSGYDIYQSQLYSVIGSFGDYTIINEPNISRGRFVLYHKNKQDFSFSAEHYAVNNFSDILFIKASNRRLIAVNSHQLIKLKELDKYYIEVDDKGNARFINTRVVMELLLDKIHESDNKEWVSLNITDKVEHVPLGDRLKEIVRPYISSNPNSGSLIYAYYIDYDAEELYLMIWAHLIAAEKLIVCLLKGQIKSLLSKNSSFSLVWKFETNVPLSETSILNKIKIDVATNNRLLRLLYKKWNTGNGFINLKVFGMYDTERLFYDYEYNRSSIRISTEKSFTVRTKSHIASALHLVHRITQILRPDQL